MAIGARILSRDNLPDDKKQVLNNIHKHIKNIREEAFFIVLKEKVIIKMFL